MATYKSLVGLGVRIRKDNVSGQLSVVGMGDDNPAPTMGEMISRDTGLQREMKELDNYSHALTNPGQYLIDKRADLLNQRPDLVTAYNMAFAKRIDDGYSEEEAKNEGKKAALERKKELMKEHNKKFPLDVKKAAQKKLEGRY